MPNYSDLDLQSLMDLLVEHTNEYSKMRTFSNYTVEEITQCKQRLREIQGAVKIRCEQGNYTMEYIIDPPANPGQQQPQQ